MKVVYFGTPDFAVPTLERLLASSHEVELVVSRPDRPIGRRQVLTPPPVVDVAKERGLECLQPKNLKGAEIAARLSESGAEAAVIVAYGKLIPASLIEIPRPRICQSAPESAAQTSGALADSVVVGLW